MVAARGGVDASATLFPLLGMGYARGLSLPLPPPPPPSPPPASRASAIASTVLIGAAFLYGFAGPAVGVQAMAASTMFSSLSQFDAGGGNHLLSPVNLLGRALPELGLDRMVRLDALELGRIKHDARLEVLERGTASHAHETRETLRQLGVAVAGAAAAAQRPSNQPARASSPPRVHERRLQAAENEDRATIRVDAPDGVAQTPALAFSARQRCGARILSGAARPCCSG